MLKYKEAKLFFYSLSFQILLVCVSFVFSQVSEELTACAEFEARSKCECILNRGPLHNHCTSADVAIVQSEQMTVQCNNSDIEELFKELTHNIMIGPLKRLNIFNCSLGNNSSMKDFLNQLGVGRVESFNFSSNQRFLHKTQFYGLRRVSDLQFNVESFEALPSDLFEYMSNVLDLQFHTNQTRLTKGIFDPFINLESLQIDGKHDWIEFPDGIFDRLKNLKTVVINQIKNLNLSRNLFPNTTSITTLELNENEFRTLPSDMFDNLKNLKFLTLKHSSLNDLPHGLLHKTSRLENIILSTNDKGNMRTLPPQFLANLKHLNQVKLSASFEELPENLFYESNNITYIDLSRNKLKNLPVNLFRDQENLNILNLDHNLLITLPDDIFKYTINLKFLYLSNNQLIKITGSIFKHLSSLEILSLGHNKLNFTADGAFRDTNLKQLFLSHNLLFQISNETFSGLYSLRVLQLDNNNLSSIASDAFCNTLGIQILNLQYNNLNINATRAFFPCLFLRDLKRLDLSFNKIATITNEDLNFASFNFVNVILKGNQIETVNLSLTNLKLKKRSSISFDENPLKCDCKIVDFVKYLKNQTNVEVRIENLMCKQPIKFQGRKLAEIDPCDLRCQNDDPTLCPEFCRCEEKTCSATFIIDCSNSKLTHLPTLPALESFKFDKIVLDVHNNSLKNLQRNGSRTYDLIQSLNMTGNSLENIEATQLPANVEILDLRRNNLRTLPDDLFDAWSRNSSKLKKIYLAHNPWPCGCESRSLLEFMHSEHNKVADKTSLLCINSTNQHQLLIHFKVSHLCRDNKQLIIIIAFVIAFCGLMAAVLIALYHRYKDEIKIWLYAHNMCLCFVSIEELERDKEYDGFVSYSHKDKEFVQKELMPFLEHGPHPYKICDHERDWLVGDTIPEQIIKSVENSRRTLIILSDNYLESVWGRMEFQAAHQLAMKERKAKVIIILYGEIKNTERIDDELQAYLNMNTYLEWGNPWFWRKLLYAMPHSNHSKTTTELSNINDNAFNMTNY